MNPTYQQLLKQWASFAPDECLATDRDYKFKVRILPAVEKRNCVSAWRLVSSENIMWRLETGAGLALPQLNFVLLTVMHHCATRQSSIQFAFSEQGTIATISNGLRSQMHPHPAIAALDAYIQLLKF